MKRILTATVLAIAIASSASTAQANPILWVIEIIFTPTSTAADDDGRYDNICKC